VWAQLISFSAKSGREGDVTQLVEMLRATEHPGNGLVRSSTYQDQKDPSRFHTLVVFESEDKARAREGDARREAALAEVRSLMAEVMDGPPEYTDLLVVSEYTL